MKNRMRYFYLALSLLLLKPSLANTQEVPDVELVFTKNNEIYRLNMQESATGKVRHTLIAEDFTGWKILRRPGKKDQFAYVRQNRGIVVMDRCGQKIFDYQRTGTGSRYWDDFTWSHSGRYLVYGVYNGAYNSSPDPGVNQLDVETGDTLRLVETRGFTYDHSPAYSLEDSQLAYIHHEFESVNWFGLIDSNGGEKKLWLQLPDTHRDAHQFFTWIDETHVLGLNTRQNALILVDISGGGNYETFDAPGANTPMIVSPDSKRFALLRSSQLSYGEIGKWQLKDVALNPVVRNFAWVDDNSIVVYIYADNDRAIYWVDLNSDNVVKITDVMITQTYGIEVLTK